MLILKQKTLSQLRLIRAFWGFIIKLNKMDTQKWTKTENPEKSDSTKVFLYKFLLDNKNKLDRNNHINTINK